MENNNNQTIPANPTNQPNQTATASQPIVNPQPVNPTPQPVQQQPQQQNVTPSDPQTGYETLEPQYRRAIDLRLLHYPYKAISNKLIAEHYKATVATVETWFSKNGACHDVYQKMVEIDRAERKKNSEERAELLEEGTNNALIVLNRVLRKAVENDEITEQEAIAARDMLDRGGVPKMSKTDGSVKVESEGLEQMATLITGILEGKIHSVTDQPVQPKQ